MYKKSRKVNSRNNRRQKASLKQASKRPHMVAAPYPQHTVPYQQYGGGNSAHWFGRLPPHYQCILGLALITLFGFIAHDHAMSNDLSNALTLLIYMFKS